MQWYDAAMPTSSDSSDELFALTVFGFAQAVKVGVEAAGHCTLSIVSDTRY